MGCPVSIEAINWALNHAPDFADHDRRQRPHLVLVLIGLANHADPEGRNAFPAIATLCRYTRLSESTVRRCLQQLTDLGVIRLADPDVVAAHIRRADRRPTGYDLLMTARRPAGSSSGGDNSSKSGDSPGDGVSYGPADSSVSGVSYGPGGVSYQATRGVISGRKGPRYDTRTVLEPSGNRPARERAPEARSLRLARPALPPPCGQCDARPGDPVSARVVWLNADRTESQRCPRCHPNPLPVSGPGAPVAGSSGDAR